MTLNIREFIESPLHQGESEKASYKITTTPWGSSPTSPVVKIYDLAGNDLSEDLLSGTASVDGDVITTPKIIDLTAGVRYRVEIQFDTGGNTLAAYGYILGEI